MKKTVDNPAGVPAPPPGRYSHVVRLEVGDSTILLLSGQCSVDDDLNVVAPHDTRGQSERIFEIIGKILDAHGAKFTDIVNIRTYLTDIGTRAEYGEVRRRFLDPEQLPTSTTVEVSALFLPEAVIEVEVMAVLPRSGE
ncbi:RidA family protein [Actinosynnema sp. NPDC047251]|uniref:Putative endoribonuclease L-PSP n=1 Tax=Saccharothrix espanaensis (strain ATCC 51144 / DSM 44229 / JCM 9112 / NBRC 15066 / NRRL 15764) TaxID=1179773 RepID=K0K2N4_SACES|nr:RidA family protein [Saccharothrix espanaensis]CCH30833.1 putative endoribonuclease L-PSP [Saccharothrix espanaensis DSM 44229]